MAEGCRIDAPLGIVPRWARNLVRRVLLDYGSEIPLIEIRWRRNQNRFDTTGTAGLGNDGVWVICITRGSDDRDARWALLHELVHVLLGSDECHSQKFHKFAFRMYPEYGISPGYGIWRESSSRFALPAAEYLGYTRIAARIRYLDNKFSFQGWDYIGQLWGLKHVY